MDRPAWSWGQSGETSDRTVDPLLASFTREAAFEGSTGKGVRVAIVDSGVDDTHPAVAGAVRGYVEPSVADDGTIGYRSEPHGDAFGHGTACAGIIHRIAPDAEIYSVRVLGPRLSGKGPVFAAGVRWAAENGMHVVNLSLGTTKREFFGLFHDIADTAYHRGVNLVTAANNMPEPSFPSPLRRGASPSPATPTPAATTSSSSTATPTPPSGVRRARASTSASRLGARAATPP